MKEKQHKASFHLDAAELTQKVLKNVNCPIRFDAHSEVSRLCHSILKAPLTKASGIDEVLFPARLLAAQPERSLYYTSIRAVLQSSLYEWAACAKFDLRDYPVAWFSL